MKNKKSLYSYFAAQFKLITVYRHVAAYTRVEEGYELLFKCSKRSPWLAMTIGEHEIASLEAPDVEAIRTRCR